MAEEGKQEVVRTLTLDSLVTGDRPSLYYLGMVGAQAINNDSMAVFMVDVLGKVHLMPPSSIKILEKPKASIEDLNTLAEEDAVRVMLQQGSEEEEIIQYLTVRNSQF